MTEELDVARNLLYHRKSEHVDELEAEAKPGLKSPHKIISKIEDHRKRLCKAEKMNEVLDKTVGYFAEEE